jgi:hypothetical protein
MEGNEENTLYKDKRTEIPVWFKIFCYSNHRKCHVLEAESGPLKINYDRGWENVDNLYQELGLDTDNPKKKLTCCVVMGIL